jgi:hypothetical protein
MRRRGAIVMASPVCEGCLRTVTDGTGIFVGVGGRPEIRVRSEPFEATIVETTLPAALGWVDDLAPIAASSSSTWVLLTESGALVRLDAGTREWTRRGESTVRAEPDREPWAGQAMRRRLHVSSRGELAAVVNDYGRWGEVVDLRSGSATLSLDGGDYCEETVPFSFAFAELRGRTFAIHRTDWNRLDISDPATGELLSARGPTRYAAGEPRPEHYLDYFHGALLVSPSSTRVLDDGWVWHPVGLPSVWSLEKWLENVWESEDGQSRMDLCARNSSWNGPFTWIDDERAVVGGLGEDDADMVAGARVFDVTSRGDPGPGWRPDLPWAREIASFAGPAGAFFSDGKWLFSADETGLSRWDPITGERTGHVPGFRPSHHHRGARELVELRDAALVRLSI